MKRISVARIFAAVWIVAIVVPVVAGVAYILWIITVNTPLPPMREVGQAFGVIAGLAAFCLISVWAVEKVRESGDTEGA